MEKKKMVKEIKNISSAVAHLKNDYIAISNIIDVLIDTRKNGNTVYVCGNGGSASTSTHLVCDLSKTSNIKGICLNDNIALNTALVNDISWECIYTYRLKQLAKKGDVLILMSTFGAGYEGSHSSNLRNAVDYANANGITTIGFSGGDGGYCRRYTLP